jgi:4-oxalocrotonate tautomerase
LALTRRLVAAVADSLGSRSDEISVALEEVRAAEWMDRVYAPDIAAREAQLTKRPGYGPLA